MLTIGLASTNRAKRSALQRVIRRFRLPATVLEISAESRVSAQPSTEEETIQGAINRVNQVLLATPEVELAVAFEGGIERTRWGLFLLEWCVVGDRSGIRGFGGGPKLQLPDEVVRAHGQGATMGEIFDRLMRRRGTGAREGAFGILTGQMVTRSDVDEQALLLALARYLEPHFYGADAVLSPISSAFAEALQRDRGHKAHPAQILYEQLELLHTQ